MACKCQPVQLGGALERQGCIGHSPSPGVAIAGSNGFPSAIQVHGDDGVVAVRRPLESLCQLSMQRTAGNGGKTLRHDLSNTIVIGLDALFDERDGSDEPFRAQQREWHVTGLCRRASLEGLTHDQWLSCKRN